MVKIKYFKILFYERSGLHRFLYKRKTLSVCGYWVVKLWYNSYEIRIYSDNLSEEQTISSWICSLARAPFHESTLVADVRLLWMSSLNQNLHFLQLLTHKVTLSWFLQHRWLPRWQGDKLFHPEKKREVFQEDRSFSICIYRGWS